MYYYCRHTGHRLTGGIGWMSICKSVTQLF